jgi:dolichol-phosphate mannosyltransferase
MTERKSIGIVAPVYNESAVIGLFHTELTAVVNQIAEKYDVIIYYVLDRSTDDSEVILEEIARKDKRVRVIVMSARFGHQAALKAGIERAIDHHAVIMMDSDLQHPPSLLPTLLKWFEGGADVVYTIRRPSTDVAQHRRLAGSLFYKFLRWLSESPIQQNAADFRLVSHRVASILVKDFGESALFLRGVIPLLGFDQVGVEFQSETRRAGQSHYNFRRTAGLAITAVTTMSTKPLQFGIWLAFLFSLLTAGLSIFYVVSYFRDSSTPSGFTSLVVVLLTVSTFLFLSIGIVGFYLGKIFDLVKSRPSYIIDREISGSE